MLRLLTDAFVGAAARRADHPFFAHAQPLCIAHRGGLGLFPENTLYAFERAAALGADAIEMDIHRTRDGELVVCHDPAIDRTTNGTGLIREMTLAEIQRHDAAWHWTQDDGATYPLRGQGITIPSLREVFAALPDRRFIIDNKPANPDMARQFARTVIDCGMQDRAMVASFYTDNLRAVRREFPDIVTSCSDPEIRFFWGMQFLRLGGLYRPQACAMQIPCFQYGVRIANRRYVTTADRRNVDVHVWTVNDEDEMRLLLNTGVRGILTDFPDRLLGVMGRG